MFFSARTVFMLLLAGFGLGFLTATANALWRWRGGWRWIACGPLLYLAAMALKIVLDVRIAPTSHNLWPFEVLATLIITCAVLGGLYLARFFTMRLKGSHAP
jgi:hypothetical protein